MGGIATVSGRGRKLKPTALKKLQGNPGKRKLNDDEPKFTELMGAEPPEWLNDLATTMWQTIMPELIANKILTVADLHNVESFCMAYARWREAEAAVNEHGILVMSAMGSLSKNPALTAINEAKKQMVQFGSLLGLDPSSRARLTGSAGKEKKKNAFAELETDL